MFGAEIASCSGRRLFAMKATLFRRIHHRTVPDVIVGLHLAALGESSGAPRCGVRLSRLEPPSSADLMFERMQ